MSLVSLFVLPGDGALAAVGDCAILLPGGTPGGRALTWCRALVDRCAADPTAALVDHWDSIEATAVDAAVCRTTNGATEVILTGAMRCMSESGTSDGQSYEFGGLAVASTDLWFPDGGRRVAVTPLAGGLSGTYSRMPVDGEVFVAAAAMAYVGFEDEATVPEALELFAGDRTPDAGLSDSIVDPTLVVVFADGSIRRIGVVLPIFSGSFELRQRQHQLMLINISANTHRVVLHDVEHVVAAGSSIPIESQKSISFNELTIRVGNLR